MAKLIKTVIKKGPSPRKEKLIQASEFTEVATSYINALKSRDIQPEFIVKHADSFRRMFFDFMQGRVAYKEDIDGQTKRIEEQAQEIDELREEIRELREELAGKKDKEEARPEAEEEEPESEPPFGGPTGPGLNGPNIGQSGPVPWIGGAYNKN